MDFTKRNALQDLEAEMSRVGEAFKKSTVIVFNNVG